MQSQLTHHSEPAQVAASSFSDSLLKARLHFILCIPPVHLSMHVHTPDTQSTETFGKHGMRSLTNFINAFIGHFIRNNCKKCYLCNCPISHCSLKFQFLANRSGTECGLLPIHLCIVCPYMLFCLFVLLTVVSYCCLPVILNHSGHSPLDKKHLLGV